MRLEMTVRRFRCDNPQCAQKTFVERFPDWLAVYARCTARLTDVIRQVGFEVGGESGARVLNYFQITASGDTVLRVVRQTPAAPVDEPRVIGVDDWALKKGRRYGTVIVNLETQRVVDLLPDRTAEILTEWLQAHPGIEVVARDRSTEYIRGIQAGAPQAVQVADRWHLLFNIRQMLERFLGTVHTDLQALPTTPACVEVLETSRTAFRRSQTEQVLSQASRAQRVARYEQIQQWRREGYNISQIAQKLGCHWETARKYYDATSFPERKRRPMMPSSLDPYLPYLEQRHLEGCENASQLWREIQALGFRGTARQVLRWLQLRRTQPAPSTPGPYRDTQPLALPPMQSTLPSSRQLAWLLVSDPEQLSPDETLILAHIRQLPTVASVYALAQQFVVMIKQRQAEQLDLWLAACSTHEVTQVRTFAVGIQQDYAAIRAALGTPWSNGQTEGQVNRLKFLKRQMYGRARFDLLRLRVLHPP